MEAAVAVYRENAGRDSVTFAQPMMNLQNARRTALEFLVHESSHALQ